MIKDEEDKNYEAFENIESFEEAVEKVIEKILTLSLENQKSVMGRMLLRKRLKTVRMDLWQILRNKLNWPVSTQLKKKSAPIAENIEMLEVFETEEMIDISFSMNKLLLFSRRQSTSPVGKQQELDGEHWHFDVNTFTRIFSMLPHWILNIDWLM